MLRWNPEWNVLVIQEVWSWFKNKTSSDFICLINIFITWPHACCKRFKQFIWAHGLYLVFSNVPVLVHFPSNHIQLQEKKKKSTGCCWRWDMQCLCFYSIIVIIGQFLTEISFWSETTSSLPLHAADNNERWPMLRTGLSNMESRKPFPRTTRTQDLLKLLYQT